MNHFANRIILGFFLCLTCVCSHAQMGTLFNGAQKLSSCLVHQVYQDKSGFIWIATSNGLNRYDGYTFRTFSAADGLKSDNINVVIQGADGNMYVGTSAGIYVKVNGKFVPIINDATGKEIHAFIRSFALTADGKLIFCTAAMGVWQITDTDKAHLIINPTGDAQLITSLAIDHKGILWAATEKAGVLEYRITGGSLKAPKFIKRDLTCESPQFSTVYCDRKDNLYVGYMTGGVYKMDAQRKGFVLIPSTANLPIYALSEDVRPLGANSLFIGTDGHGMKVLNTLTGTIRDAEVSSKLVDLSRTKVCTIFTDRNSNVWMGLFQKGVYMQPGTTTPFGCLGMNQTTPNAIGEQCVMSLYKQRNGNLWVASDQDGLYAIDANNQLIRHLAAGDGKTTMPATVLCMEEDLKGRLWIGSYTEGFGWIDQTTGAYHRAPLSYKIASSTFDIRTDYKGRLWIGTLGDGLICYDPESETMKQFKADGTKNALLNDYVVEMTMSMDRKTLFVGTSTGLCSLDIPSLSWTKTLRGKTYCTEELIEGLCVTDHGTLWVGTPTGLCCINLKTCAMKKYTTDDGLPHNHVNSIEEDRNGTLWVSTSNGLCRFSPKDGKANNYYVSDGLQGNEYSSGCSFYDRSTDVMYFGGISGVSVFSPGKIKYAAKKLTVTLSGLFRGNERVVTGAESGFYTIANESVTTENEFNFSHDDNTLTMHFSTLTYSDVDRISYAYSINGDEWIEMPVGENKLTLSRLQPGDYKFRVVAIDNGVRSEPKEFMVVIHNPWYFTPLMRIIYLLLVIGAVWRYIHLLRVRNRQRLLVQEHIHKEELNEQKLRFFINISHEIRTPMTLIVSPLLQLLREDGDAHRQAVYEIMKRNAERILHLVNQILDIRKIDKGQMLMQMRETDLVEFTAELLRVFEPQASSKKIDLEFEHNDERLPVWIDRSQFDKILLNLMSNAMKYTSVGGVVRVSLMTAGGKAVMKVYDNGEQIPEKSLEHIFERFYQATSLTNQSKTGTGVGLDLTRSLVELHHGEISVANVDDGVEFTVTLPLGKEHLSDKEIATEPEPQEKTEILQQELDASIMANEDENNDKNGEQSVEILTPKSKRPLVVIVEDDDDIREYLTQELSLQYRTLAFTNGAEALPQILREVPSLVVSDVLMPQMDGNTLCARIKSNVNTNDVPVILLTAKTRDEDRMDGLESGADLYLTKPFNLDILRRSIANLISSRRVMQNKYTGQQDQSDHIDEVKVENADEKLLNRILAVVNANLSNSDLNIDMICTEVGISRVHLHRKMKELTNQTPHDFIRNLRLKQAARLLSRKGQNITEVMYRCGFNSSTSFSTMFKKMYGQSPRDYQKTHAE